ncbi:uncharacterized protein LOC131293069 [Anopheles ziemanni]|uniref:uncharacterized protein LOC131293069 n=1 Tax=Anopheles ziemanni TaxID=345580 RepID=UPI00265E0EFE|nr:uncharacterized protein LOC131293069 [Anopheles ziemanni]
MVLILRTAKGNTLSTVSDSLIEPNRTHGRPAYFGEFAHMAAIGWSQPEGSTLWNCGGSLIWGNYILTAAHCAVDGSGIAPDVVRLGDLNLYDASDDIYAQQRKIVEIIRHPYHVFSMKYHDIALMRLDLRLATSPTHIRYEGNKISAVAEVFKHPKYEENSLYNNIGILKLKDPVKFSKSFVPACLSLEDDSSIKKLTISGRGSLELNDFEPNPTAFWSNKTVDVLATSYIHNVTNCTDSFKSHLAKGLTDEHLCLGSDLFLVPGSCNQILGGPIQTKAYHFDYKITNVYALNLYGKDCGYVPEDDMEWLIVPNQRTSIDDCHVRYHRYGLPLPSTPQVAFGTTAYITEFAHIAAIGWTREDGAIVWNCGGSLIWENYVLTAAHCTADADNNVPDVARLGDINLYNTEDDMFAQQRRIVEIIRHPEHMFSRRYHDIALMRLDKGVILHDTVAPACLWNEDVIRFKSFEAAGWGDTGFAEKRSPVLLKVSLSPADPVRCSNHFLHTRGLRDGLHPNQMCAGDEQMDTCPGDSGGPLQVKLLHNTRVTPFVVGVTSFGAACGQSVPGVYTRVAPYIPWIRTVLNDRGENATEQMFQPSACALRYVRYREYDPAVILGGTNGQQSLEFANAQLLKAATEHQVSIHWNETLSTQGSTCYGIIFDERWVVTLARCTEIDGVPPTHIRYGGNKMNHVAEYFQHPRYETNSPYNDLGLLKLKDRVTFGGSFVPACLWYKEDTPVSKLKTAGRGLRNQIERKIPSIAIATGQVSGLGTPVKDSNRFDDFGSWLVRGLVIVYRPWFAQT